MKPRLFRLNRNSIQGTDLVTDMNHGTQKTQANVAVQKPVHSTFIRTIAITLGLMFCAFSTLSQADDQGQIHQMSLTHHDFEAWTFTPRANDEIVITNESDITHSIYVTYSDGTVVNLGVQLPGETVTWQVPEAGDYLLQCWIHPIIRAEMTAQSPIDASPTIVQEVEDG